MMDQLLQLINEFLDKIFIYGPFWIYLVLFITAFVENIFPPIPGDFITLTGGALAASGRLNIFLVFVLVYLGGIASISLLYYLGQAKGRQFFIRKNYRFFSKNDISRLEEWFNSQGALLLIFNRFIVGARAAIAVVTGISNYNFWKMLVYVSISFWIFNGLLLFSSYVFIVNFETIEKYLHLYERIVWPIIIVIILWLIIRKIMKVKSNAK
jgi:membrane protein DedA with SNARE-associated domain